MWCCYQAGEKVLQLSILEFSCDGLDSIESTSQIYFLPQICATYKRKVSKTFSFPFYFMQFIFIYQEIFCLITQHQSHYMALLLILLTLPDNFFQCYCPADPPKYLQIISPPWGNISIDTLLNNTLSLIWSYSV